MYDMYGTNAKCIMISITCRFVKMYVKYTDRDLESVTKMSQLLTVTTTITIHIYT